MELAPDVQILADKEGLTGHKASVEIQNVGGEDDGYRYLYFSDRSKRQCRRLLHPFFAHTGASKVV